LFCGKITSGHNFLRKVGQAGSKFGRPALW
jgi:hypothetical protein